MPGARMRRRGAPAVSVVGRSGPAPARVRVRALLAVAGSVALCVVLVQPFVNVGSHAASGQQQQHQVVAGVRQQQQPPPPQVAGGRQQQHQHQQAVNTGEQRHDGGGSGGTSAAAAAAVLAAPAAAPAALPCHAVTAARAPPASAYFVAAMAAPATFLEPSENQRSAVVAPLTAAGRPDAGGQAPAAGTPTAGAPAAELVALTTGAACSTAPSSPVKAESAGGHHGQTLLAAGAQASAPATRVLTAVQGSTAAAGAPDFAQATTGAGVPTAAQEAPAVWAPDARIQLEEKQGVASTLGDGGIPPTTGGTTAFHVPSAAAGSIRGTSGHKGSDRDGSGGSVHAGGAASVPLSVLTPTAFMPGGPSNSEGEAAAAPAPLPDQPPEGGEREAAAAPAPLPARRRAIEDGFLAVPNRFPFVVAVVRPSDGAYLCVGSIVHPRVVLTAAHCCSSQVGGSPNPLIAVAPAGQLGLIPTNVIASNRRMKTMKVSGAPFEVHYTRSYIHPKYQPGKFDYDVSALILPRPVLRQQAKLPSQGQSFPAPPGGASSSSSSSSSSGGSSALARERALSDGSSGNSSGGSLVVLGWGSTADGQLSNNLREAVVQPVDRGVCQSQFNKFYSKVTDQQTCVTGKTCAGDSGGPVILTRGGQEDVLMGQVSFGYPRKKGQGCPVPNPSTVITDFTSARIHMWIEDVLKEVDTVPTPLTPLTPLAPRRSIVRGFAGPADLAGLGSVGGVDGLASVRGELDDALKAADSSGLGQGQGQGQGQDGGMGLPPGIGSEVQGLLLSAQGQGQGDYYNGPRDLLDMPLYNFTLGLGAEEG